MSRLNAFRVAYWKLAFFILVVPVAYFYFENLTVPFLSGESDTTPVVYDSLTYMNLSREFEGLDGLGIVFLLNRNLLGPIALVKLLGANSFNIFVFNCSLFYLCLAGLLKTQRIESLAFFIALTINPLLFASLTSINKEILSVCALLLTLTYTYSGSRRYLAIALLISLFARQELTLLIVGYSILRQTDSARLRLIAVLFGVFAVSLTLPSINDESIRLLYEYQTAESVGLTLFMNRLSENYAFFLALIPKIAMNLFGDSVLYFFSGREQDFSFFSAVSGLLFALTIWLARRSFTLTNDAFLLIVSYLILFSTPAFIHHRYFLPIYVPLAALAFMKKVAASSAQVATPNQCIPGRHGA